MSYCKECGKEQVPTNACCAAEQRRVHQAWVLDLNRWLNKILDGAKLEHEAPALFLRVQEKIVNLESELAAERQKTAQTGQETSKNA